MLLRRRSHVQIGEPTEYVTNALNANARRDDQMPAAAGKGLRKPRLF
jgi:hypothetical protein